MIHGVKDWMKDITINNKPQRTPARLSFVRIYSKKPLEKNQQKTFTQTFLHSLIKLRQVLFIINPVPINLT